MTSEWVQQGNITITSNETESSSGDVNLPPENGLVEKTGDILWQIFF